MSKTPEKYLLEKAFSVLDVAILTVDTGSRQIADCNQATEAIFGYSKDELIGQNTRMLHVDEAMYRKFSEDKKLSESFVKDGSFFTRFQMRRKNGEVFNSEHTVTGIQDDAGKTTKVISVVRDISKEVSIVNKLNEKQAQIDLLVNRTPGVIYACKYDGHGAFIPVFCTPNMEGMMGYTPEDFYTEENLWSNNIHPDDAPTVFKGYDRLFADDRLLHRYRWKHKDGHYIWVRDELTLSRNKEGEPDKIVGVWVNIDEQKAIEVELAQYRTNLEKIAEEKTQELHQAQEELIQKERLAVLGQLATTVSHELRNPLGTIANIIDVIDNSANHQDFSGIHEKLALALRNVERCDRIINELLEFASGKEPQIEPVKFDGWLKSLLSEINWPPEITCDLNLSADVDVSLDISLTDRAINNIINNAIHALQSHDSPDKKINVTTKVNNGDLTVIVCDNGPGMSEKCLKHIFDPLFSTKVFGVGLGMPIVKNAVESLKGTIDIQSREGEGTTVTLMFPMSKHY